MIRVEKKGSFYLPNAEILKKKANFLMFFIKDKERKDAKINPKSSKEQTCTPKGITVPHTPAKML